MIIHGGISEINQTLDNMCVLNINDYTWSEAIVKKDDEVLKSKKATQLHNQLYFINNDGSQGEAMDMKGFKFESPGALSHHAAVTVIYDKYGSRNTKMLTLYNESNQRRKAPS